MTRTQPSVVENKAQSAQVEASKARMALTNVTRGPQPRPLKMVVYGVSGVGKSTFASGAPSPIFLCAGDNAAWLDVARFPAPRTWEDAIEAVRTLIDEPHEFRTLVIDTLDDLEALAWHAVCSSHGVAQ